MVVLLSGSGQRQRLVALVALLLLVDSPSPRHTHLPIKHDLNNNVKTMMRPRYQEIG